VCSDIEFGNRDTSCSGNWKLGLDASKKCVLGENNVETYDLNAKNGVMRGGPTCTFIGKEIPCFVCTSPNASITSKLLAAMLKQIDSYGLFPRSKEGMPFLLVDGHHSPTRLPFMKYVTDK
jgi:hypothetical protein